MPLVRKSYDLRILLLLSVGTSVLSACSSSSNDSGNNSRITSFASSVGSLEGASQIGVFSISEDTEFQTINTLALFFEAPTSVQDNVLASALATPADTCEVEADEPEVPLFEDLLLNNYASVSAGEQVIVSSPAGVYAQFTPFNAQGGVLYLEDFDLSFPGPDTLTASVAGDEFPAAELTMTKPASVAGHSVSNDDGNNSSVQRGATITWIPSDSLDTLVAATFRGSSDTLDPTTSFSIDCLMIDDGEFSIPPAVFDEGNTISGGDAVIIFEQISRTRAVVSRLGTNVWVGTYSTNSLPDVN